MGHRYVFRSDWTLPVPPEAVYPVLERLDLYPQWWPQVRAAERLDDDTCRMTVRSTLPMSLRFTAHRSRADPDLGLLEARLSGDLVGFTRWRIIPDGAGTRLRFEEEVEASRPLLRRLSFARPAFRANHALMMRSGRRGLVTRLEL